MQFFTGALLVYIVFMNVSAFALYGEDKERAKRHKWRIPERVLLLCGVCGGAAGAILGMEVFRHKTKHWYFWGVNIAALVLHLAALCLIYGKDLIFK
ncbi:MAG: DUF1294 domain-containing protein [Oscillospiraceae bacterium]|nr:DUF1294 domain-containing protein [Oscillospiraceae bacterium]